MKWLRRKLRLWLGIQNNSAVEAKLEQELVNLRYLLAEKGIITKEEERRTHVPLFVEAANKPIFEEVRFQGLNKLYRALKPGERFRFTGRKFDETTKSVVGIVEEGMCRPGIYLGCGMYCYQDDPTKLFGRGINDDEEIKLLPKTHCDKCHGVGYVSKRTEGPIMKPYEASCNCPDGLAHKFHNTDGNYNKDKK